MKRSEIRNQGNCPHALRFAPCGRQDSFSQQKKALDPSAFFHFA
jgi:hypothetical protein